MIAAAWALTSVLLGSVPSGAPVQSPGFVLDGSLPGERLGAALVRLPDLDGDGGDELALGAPHGGAPARRSGSVQVVRGRDGTLLLHLEGLHARDRFGASLACLGDLDGDGRADLLIGAPQRGGPEPWSATLAPGGAVGTGYVDLRSSRTGVLLRRHTTALYGEGFGFAVAGGADVDGDLVGDYLVGAPAPISSTSEPGDAWLFSGASGVPLRHHVGGSQVGTAGFGHALTFTGDLDGDGVADYAVGAPGVSSFGPGHGRVSAFSGATGAVLWTSHLTGEMNLGLGYGLATCGDADGDGVVDLLAASTGIALEGYATWLSGADGSLVSSYGSYLLGLGRRVGAAPAALWDLGGGPRPGVAFTGSVGNTVLLWSVEGPAPFSSLQPPADPEAGFGLALAGGDFDGDGRLDLAVGAPDADSGAAGAGRVRVYPRVGP